MTAEIAKIELGLHEVERLIPDYVFIVDVPALKGKTGELISGGSGFLNTLLSLTFGKVHFVSTDKESHVDLNKWIDLWLISTNQFFIRPHVWNPKEPVIKLVQGLNRSNPDRVIVLTHSPKLEKSIIKQCPEVFKIMKVDKDVPDFNYHKVWLQFHDPNFWTKKQ